MITITKKEEMVLKQIKDILPDYPDGIALSDLNKVSNLREYDLNLVLNRLNETNLINYENTTITPQNIDLEVNAVESLQDVTDVNLNIKELKALEIIRSIVDENKTVPKYILEGKLLYGDLKLSNFRMYHIILSLENKGIIKSRRRKDGRYYILLE